MSGNSFFVAAAAFATGVFFRSLYVFNFGVIGFLILIFLIVFCAWFFTKQRRYILVSVILLAFILGVVRVSFVQMSLPEVFSKKIGTTISTVGTIVAAPMLREKGKQVIISISKNNQHTNILVNVPLISNVQYGDTVRVYGKLTKPKPFSTEYGRVFRYDRYLAEKGVFAIMQHASITKNSQSTNPVTRAYVLLLDIKKVFLKSINSALPEPESSLAGGLVAGGTQGLGKSLLQDFIRSGLIHIVVLSGYNVMIVAETVLAALVFLSRRRAAIVAAFIIGAFVLAAGAGAASIRAGIMALFGLLAMTIGRTYDVTRALVLTAVIMILWNPLLLAYSVGFDLSVIATLGLIFGVPILEPKLSFIKSDFLREIISATASAQISVLPLLLYTNGLFSIVSLPANILVLPVVPITMAASAIAGLIGGIVPILSSLAGLPAYMLLKYIIYIVHTSSNLPFAAFAIPPFSFVWVIAIYSILIYFMVRATSKKTLFSFSSI